HGNQPSGGAGGLAAFLPFILIFLIFWLLILRPQAKRQKEHQRMLASITKGDRIVTTGGIYGLVLKVNEKEGTLVVKIDDNVKIELDRSAVARRIGREE
ncbi:MAG: preprotein translocase subunit YajC, partial [bacterium]